MDLAQLRLALPPGRGGRRRGAGRKPAGARPRVAHVRRPSLNRRHPVHVTLRAVPGLGSFRRPQVFPAMRAAIARAQRQTFRVCHFSVQSNHVHMLIEAESRQALSSGIRGLAIRLARALNRVLARRGSVWADRYHRHDLATPREVRHAVVYVLDNIKKHQPGFRGLDTCSSAWGAARTVVAAARTWLLATGWRNYGPIGVDEAPRSS